MEENSKDDIVIPVEYFALNRNELQLSSDDKEQEAFAKYSEARQSYGVIKFLAVFCFPTIIYAFVMALIHAKSWYFLAAIAIGMVVIRNPIWFLAYYVRAQLKAGVNTPFVNTFAPWLSFLSSILSIFGAFFFGLFLIARVINGKCSSLDQYHMYSCNSEYESHALPQEHMLALMLLPIALSTVLKTIQAPYIAVCWCFSVGCIAIAIVISNSHQSIPALVMYVPISIAILVEDHRQGIILYLVLRKQQSLFEEKKVLSEEAQNELRFMIANMAHDLKTPLSSFMNGVEILSSLTSELERSTIPDLKLHRSIRENIKNLFNVNNFMTMTVNRCIDYMKASKGIKLEPRLETINLQEVLSMPLNCMRDLQSRIAIIQKPIPGSVCSHIITDLQWFQENLFCLVSNAVKYSSHGSVTVSVSMISEDDPRFLFAGVKEIKEYPVRTTETLQSGEGKYSPLTAADEYGYLDRLPSERPVVLLSDENKEGSFLSMASKSDVFVDVERGKASLEEEDERKEESCDSPTEAKNNSSTRGFLLIEVEDTGIGLSDEVKLTLFTPFKQAQRRAGGTGLGLYSLAKRVDALGGYYGVSNRRDGEQGSIFWFAIPYRADEVMSRMDVTRGSDRFSSRSDVPSIPSTMMHLSVTSSSSTPSVTVQPVSPSPKVTVSISTVAPLDIAIPPPGKLRILLVDDSVTILKMTSNLLKRHGHVVDQEENGADALKALERSRSSGVPYDIVLMDLNMPVMDGLEAMKRLREVEKQMNLKAGSSLYHQKVFAFTANSDNDSMQEAMECGADDFISKPFSIQTFSEKYEKLSHSV